VISLAVVGVRVCTVSFKSATGISHAVDVEAESLYEAAALALARLTKDGWVEGLGPGTRLDIQVRVPATAHSVTLMQIRCWCDGAAVSPDEVLKRKRLKELLETK
jgi:hypothetical protein